MNMLRFVEELEAMVETGTRVPGFRRKVLVDIDQIASLSDDLRKSIPANIQEAHEIVTQKDSILNQAYLEAQRVKSATDQEVAAMATVAQQEHHSMVNESEITKAAEAKAQEIKMESAQLLQEAQKRAYAIESEAKVAAASCRNDADQYAREVLFNLEEQLSDSLAQVRRGIDALRTSAPQSVPVREGVPA